MDSAVGLAIQCAGIFLVTLLSFFMMRWFQSVATRYWTIAWTCLSISLVSLFAGFRVQGELQRICYFLYFLGEYGFGLMFIAGCRNHAQGERLNRKHASIFVPFAVFAAVLPHLSVDFNDLFTVQAFLMAGLFGTAFYFLRPARRRGSVSPGVRVMSAALFLLAIDFLHYVPVFSSRNGVLGFRFPQAYFKYTSIFDLILEILLGFGTIMVLMEGVRREVEAMNRELTAARDRLEQILRVDPLTGALTRHAFDSVLSTQEKAPGCAAIIDLDNLKPINDSYGHAAGDAAIRTVARAVRAVTRADDMLFRWGGDEFLVLMFGMSEPLARQRLNSLNALLAQSPLPNGASNVVVTVSHGLSTFDAKTDLHQAIERADEAMYRSKQAAKALVRPVNE